MSWNPVNDVKKALSGAKHEIDNGLHRIEGCVKSAEHKLEGKIDDGLHKIEGNLQTAEHVIESRAREAEHRIEEAITEKLPEALKALESSISKELSKGVFKEASKAVHQWHSAMERFRRERGELVADIDEVGFQIVLKLNVEITLLFSQFFTRANDVSAVFDRYANEGIELRRRDIIAMVQAVGPTSVCLGVEAEIALGVDAGFGAYVTDVPLHLFLQLADIALEHAGVPE